MQNAGGKNITFNLTQHFAPGAYRRTNSQADDARRYLQSGARTKYEHSYPDYFPQAASNPQEPWCYPDAALGEFRRWFWEPYVGEGKFENYLNNKVKDKGLPASFAQLAIAAYKSPAAAPKRIAR